MITYLLTYLLTYIQRPAARCYVQELISRLLTMDDSKRPTADELLQHCWVAVSIDATLSLVSAVSPLLSCIHYTAR